MQSKTLIVALVCLLASLSIHHYSFAAPIKLAGYLQADLRSAAGGDVTMWAYAPDLGYNSKIEVLYEGIPTGLELWPGGDAGTHLFQFGMPAGLPPETHLFEFRASGSKVAEHTTWPYLESTAEPSIIELDLPADANPFATSEEFILPFPSSFYQVEDPTAVSGYRMAYPPTTLRPDPGVPDVDVYRTNLADGSSPAGPILVHFGVDINQTYLTGQNEPLESLDHGNPIALFNLDTGERVMFMAEMDMNRRPGYDGRYALIIRPLEPMEPAHRHLVVLTTDLRDTSGSPLQTPPAFRALRDRIPTDSQRVEDVRQKYEDIFTFLQSKGYLRDEVLLAWDFMVASEEYLTGSVRSMRDQALDAVENEGVAYVIDSIQNDPEPEIARVVKGRFRVPSFLTVDSDVLYTPGGLPIRQPEDDWYTFGMIIPAKAKTDGPLDLVQFGHGLFGGGQDYLTGWGKRRFGRLAEENGAVLLGTDWIGLSGADRDIIIQQVIPNLNRISLVTDRLQQSIVNNIVLTEVAMRAMTFDTNLSFNGGPLLDANVCHYYGVSLGGIQGSSFMAMSPRIKRGVLAVPGCGWLNMLSRSVNWNLFRPIMDGYYPDPLLQQMGISIIQTRFDLSDPVNLARHIFKSPLPDNPPKSVLLQESIGDSQVPNLTTEMLARVIGVGILTPEIYDVPLLPRLTGPTTDSALVQIYDQARADADFPPEENVPPTDDNGVHGSILDMPHVLEQVFHFLNTGEVIQTCNGECDPD